MMKSTVTKEEAYRLLQVKPPFTEQQLISAFRNAALKHHPDTGGDKETFIQVFESRELLMPDVGKDSTVSPIDGKMFTIDGVRISELGRGLKVSASKCKDCSGKGYMNIPYYAPCVCSILRDFYGSRMYHKDCQGTGYIRDPRDRFFVCDNCKGTGEIANFNGLFGRGSLMQNGNLSQKERKGR